MIVMKIKKDVKIPDIPKAKPVKIKSCNNGIAKVWINKKQAEEFDELGIPVWAITGIRRYFIMLPISALKEYAISIGNRE
jgi:hypothetical protein